jgi:hypothetical protein
MGVLLEDTNIIDVTEAELDGLVSREENQRLELKETLEGASAYELAISVAEIAGNFRFNCGSQSQIGETHYAAAIRVSPYRPLALCSAMPLTNSVSPIGFSDSRPSARLFV